MRAISVFIFSLFYSFVAAETHTWYYQCNWVNANPDGTYERPVIGFNNSWPLPTLRVKTGDRIQFYLNNGFDDRNTTLHFHGLFQNGTSQMDGPEMVTQCPIAPGDTMLYNFTVPDQVGTYWYHSHTSGQYGDGMRGVFIIEPEDGEYPFEFDEEVVLPIGEWYHSTADVLQKSFMNLYNPTGAEPIPQNLLFNDTRNNTWNVEPNKTYFVRIINVGGFVSQYLYMEDHEFEIVEVDGIYVQKNTTDMIYITVAQRYGVLIKTKDTADKNYAFMSKFDDTMLDTIPSDLVLNSTNYIVYDDSLDMPDEYTVDSIDDFFDDFYLRPTSNETLLDDADLAITVDVVMDNLGNGVNYAFFNNITYVAPKVPVIGTAMSAGEYATNSLVYGNSHAYVLQSGDIIDIRLNNQDTGKHPFHLHGHVFQVIERGASVDDDDDPVAFNASDHTPYPEYPMIRDTVYVNPQSYIVLRFKADNPGVWFFHCHIEWHLEQGLALVLIEAPEEMQDTDSQAFTENYKEVCKNVGVNITGNAAGDTTNYLDLTGANVQEKALPSGFTAKGYVAMVFSCIAGFLGIATIAFYGMAEVKDIEMRVARDLDVQLDRQEEAELVADEAVYSAEAEIEHEAHRA